MREIKFRAKDSQGNWRIGNIITDGVKAVAIIQQIQNPIQNGCANGWCFSIDSETVGQFTGLLDKNGKEIFEGDVVKAGEHENPRIIEIIWNERTSSWGTKYSFESDTHTIQGPLFEFCETNTDLDNNPTYEIIGNIHENPELLK